MADEDRAARLTGPALAVLERHAGRRGSQLASVLACAQLAAPAARWAWQRGHAREDFTVAVGGIDDIYADLHEWILDRLPDTKRKALIAETSQKRTRLRYDGEREHTVSINGHAVKVAVQREPIPGGRENLPHNWREQLDKIMFTAASAAARDAVVALIEELRVEKHGRPTPPPLKIPSRWGGEWMKRSDLPPRTLDSIILKRGQLEGLVGDLERFLGSEREYLRIHQPWHRGYLFHGAPGTGKTSCARAIAHHFDIPVYYLPLGDLENDTTLMALVSQIKPRSMLLIEDADIFHAATARTEKADKTSLAALLNVLDGIWTPHGLITVLTTNHREALDSAIIRAGRIDVEEEFGPLDIHQAQALLEYLDPGRDLNPACTPFVGLSPAEMIRALRTLPV